MTDLPTVLADAYCWRYGLDRDRVTADPADALLAAVAAGEITRDDLVARRSALADVQLRCVVSRIGREFLDRVIATLP